MNKRILGIIIIISGLIILAAIVYFIFIYRFSQPEQAEVTQPVSQNQPANQVEPITQPLTSVPTTAIIPPKKTEVGQDDLKRMASAFVERFGSYSNQSDFGNIRDLKIFMSLSLQAWADNYINQANSTKGNSNIYYGITTKAIASEVKNFDNDLGQAEILVKTQRREAASTTINASSFYQEITIKFIKEKGIWKVDQAFWQNR